MASAVSPAGSHLAAQCGICGTLLTGAMSVVFRTVGIRRSSRNPNLCNRCGTHVEEGRIVEMTVLFADLSSFTEMTQALGPEKTHEVVDAFLRMATSVLVRHGAFIDKYVGDAVMALFNVPVRRDDHARQAVVAATELIAELGTLGDRFGLPLQASVGIATGWARVGRLGSEDNKDYTAIGDAVNLAARLQGKANAGEIVMSAESRAKHPSDFGDAAPERLALKGFAEPVEAYRLFGKGDVPPAEDLSEAPLKKKISLGAAVFAVLGAPCAVATLIGPLAVAFGAGSLFGLAAVLVFLDQSAVRIPVLLLATLAALANLYTLRHARKLRMAEKIPAHLKVMTRLEKRRSLFVLAASLATLAVVVFEVIAHAMLH
jgi:adenylate cyclase